MSALNSDFDYDMWTTPVADPYAVAHQPDRTPMQTPSLRRRENLMTDEQQLADAFWQMNRAVLKINEILDRNPALAENLPITPPKILDADEIAAECQLLAEYYEKRAR
jgi:hypothetical protein